jgi:hypothetical protein
MISEDPEYLPSNQRDKYGTKADRSYRRLYDCIPPEVLRQIATVFTVGARKHAKYNYLAHERDFSEHYNASFGHTEEFRESRGEAIDPDTGVSPIIHAIVRKIMIADLHNKGLLEWDEQPQAGTGKDAEGKEACDGCKACDCNAG